MFLELKLTEKSTSEEKLMPLFAVKFFKPVSVQKERLEATLQDHSQDNTKGYVKKNPRLDVWNDQLHLLDEEVDYQDFIKHIATYQLKRASLLKNIQEYSIFSKDGRINRRNLKTSIQELDTSHEQEELGHWQKLQLLTLTQLDLSKDQSLQADYVKFMQVPQTRASCLRRHREVMRWRDEYVKGIKKNNDLSETEKTQKAHLAKQFCILTHHVNDYYYDHPATKTRFEVAREIFKFTAILTGLIGVCGMLTCIFFFPPAAPIFGLLALCGMLPLLDNMFEIGRGLYYRRQPTSQQVWELLGALLSIGTIMTSVHLLIPMAVGVLIFQAPQVKLVVMQAAFYLTKVCLPSFNTFMRSLKFNRIASSLWQYFLVEKSTNSCELAEQRGSHNASSCYTLLYFPFQIFTSTVHTPDTNSVEKMEKIQIKPDTNTPQDSNHTLRNV